MRIRDKQYPHPVINPYDELHKDLFNCKLSVDEDTERGLLLFDVSYELNNDKIKNLIREKMATFAIHIECASTMKRLIFTTFDNSKEYEIPVEHLNKTVEVNFFVLAVEAISEYSNVELDPYSEGFTFGLLKGDLLAIADTEILEIEKDPIIDVESIFELVPDKSRNAKPISIDLSSSKIGIRLPKDNFETLKRLHRFTSNRVDKILMSMYYVPAMIETLYSIRADHLSQDDTYIEEIRDTPWYKSIKIRLEKIKYDIENLPEDNLLGIAHEMLDDPNKNAMDDLEQILEGEV